MNKYTVTFFTNGYGQQPVALVDISVLPELPMLEEDGFTFEGWYLDEDLTALAEVGMEVTSDITLYACWSRNRNTWGNSADDTSTYVITDPSIDFVDPGTGGGGGSTTGYSIYYHINNYGTQPGTRYYQTALPNPLPTLTDTRARFVGWYTDSSLTTSAVAGATISADAHLYAKWILRRDFLVDVDAIWATMFDCPGCDNFADYVNKVNISKYNNQGYPDSDGTFICISDILTQYDLLDQYKNNLKTYYPNYQNNGESTIVGLMKANRDGCGGTSVGYVDLPYYHTNAQGTLVQISPILAGTMPKFNLKHSLTTPGTYTLKIENSKLVCGNSTVGYTQINAEDSTHTPLRVLVVMQGAGGGGGGGFVNTPFYYGGCGGGSGAACVALLDVSNENQWTLSVGSGGYGGSGDSAAEGFAASPGGAGGNTTASCSDFSITCGGGGGGGRGTSNSNDWVGGISGTFSSTANATSLYTILVFSNGAAGAHKNTSTGSISALSASFGHTLFKNSAYSTEARSAISDDLQAGAPSAHSSGTPENSTSAGPGAGGCGGNANMISYESGIKGGDGFIKIYY